MLTHNDGLLTSSLSRSRNVSFETSRNIVANAVEQMRRELSSNGFVRLGRVGVLKMVDGVMSFEPGRANALSPATLWLPKLELKCVSDIARARELSRKQFDVQGNPRFAYYAKRVGRIAASLALLIALGIVLSTPIKIDNAQYASLGLENFKPAAANSDDVRESLMRRPGDSSAALVIVLDRFDDACETADTASHNAYVRSRKIPAEKIAAVADLNNTLRFDETDRYCLVVASLPNEFEADKYIKQSRDTRLGVLAKDGRYRIYAATGENLRQAQATAQHLSDRYPGVWVCRK